LTFSTRKFKKEEQKHRIPQKTTKSANQVAAAAAVAAVVAVAVAAVAVAAPVQVLLVLEPDLALYKPKLHHHSYHPLLVV
jgi:hypothetical protein